MSDPQKYRSKEEVEQYKQRDPVEAVRKTILEKKLATEKELEDIDNKIVQTVEESVKFAEESNFPDPSEALTDVYVQQDYPFVMD
jgi:pyruvate dehydrogenase E1 component alpha subunit